MKEFTGIVIADEHFGVIDADKLYEEHQRIIIDFIKELDNLDVIFIAGDYFDHLLSLNEKSTARAMEFFDELTFWVENLGTKIRIIYGTESHECKQYSWLISRAAYINVDIKVINHVQEELIDDIWVLYIPEEYIYNKQEYYKEFFTGEKKYDYIIGHGIIQEMMEDAIYHLNKSSKNSNRAKAPIFTSTELSENCKGTVYFGHYHMNKNIHNKVFYVGSFTRWCFGEDEPKGFYYFTKNDDEYSHKFIENTMADKFITFNYGYESPIFKSEERMENELHKIEKFINNDVLSHVRLIMTVPEEYPNAEGLLVSLSERFKNSKGIKIKVVNGYVSKKQKINKEYLDSVKQKYSFIFDKNMPIAEQAENFIHTKFEIELSSERIDLHLKTKNVLEIESEN